MKSRGGEVRNAAKRVRSGQQGKPNVRVKVKSVMVGLRPPTATLRAARLLGPFVVASFENGPDAAYLDSVLDGQVSERRKQVAQAGLLYDTLAREALSPGASVEMIMKVADEAWRT
jgi:Domain of unknown function (DUF5753)